MVITILVGVLAFIIGFVVAICFFTTVREVPVEVEKIVYVEKEAEKPEEEISVPKRNRKKNTETKKSPKTN